MSLWDKGHANAALALALIHHLATSSNVPLDMVAGFFRRICDFLVIEFIPKCDSDARKLLTGRADIFAGYAREGSERGFSKVFVIVESLSMVNSDRVLCLMRLKGT